MKHESLSIAGEDGKTPCNSLTPETEKVKELKFRKEKIMEAKPSPTRRESSKKHSPPIFHVVWDGFVEQECEIVRYICQLCEKDLLFAPVDDKSDDYYAQIDEPRNHPQVSVLACGHVYHKPCLDQATSEEELRDPICFICLSFED